MITYCKKNDKTNALFKNGNIEDSLLFEKRKFTHILCLYFTIYHFKNKNIFFKNCYQWLKPGGYLIIHLVEKEKFDTVFPVGNNLLFGSPKTQTGERITNQTIDFNDFKYKYSYDFNKSSHNVSLLETFEDSVTENIRQNERTLYMEDINSILRISVSNGFVPNAGIAYKNNILPNPFQESKNTCSHSNIINDCPNIMSDFCPLNMKEINGDSHQYLYILERS
jgi:SAM-dependent methyltransferase